MPENQQKSTSGESSPDFEFKEIDDLEEAGPVFDDEDYGAPHEVSENEEMIGEKDEVARGEAPLEENWMDVGLEQSANELEDSAVEEALVSGLKEPVAEESVMDELEASGGEETGTDELGAPIIEDAAAEKLKSKTVLPTSRNRGHRNLAAVAFGGQTAGSDSHRHFGCPHCAQPIDVSPEDEGGEKACKHCGASVKVPEIHRFERELEGETGDQLKGSAAVSANLDHAGVEGKAALHRLGPDRQPTLIPKGEDVPVLAEGSWNDDQPAHAIRPQLPASSSTVWKRIGFIAVILLVLAVVGVNLVILNKGAEAAKKELEKKLDEPPPLKTGDQLLAEKLLKLMEDFSAERSIEGRLGFIRSPQRAEPRMSRYYSHHGLDAPIPAIQPRTLERELLFGRSFVKFAGLQNGQEVLVYFEDKGGDEFKVDWESMVGYADSNWKSFVVNQPLGSYAFRLLLSRDDYYNYQFADPTVYVCVQLLDVNDSARCYGYAKRDSSIGRLLLDSLPEEKEMLSCRVVVRIAEPGTDRHQVFIEKLDIGWIEE